MPEKAGSRSGGNVTGRAGVSGRSARSTSLPFPSDILDIRVLILSRTLFKVDVASLLRLDRVSLEVLTIFLRAPLVLLVTRSVIDSVRSFEDAPIILRS